jgi:hypothetical protein
MLCKPSVSIQGQHLLSVVPKNVTKNLKTQFSGYVHRSCTAKGCVHHDDDDVK